MKAEDVVKMGEKFLITGTWDILHQVSYIKNYGGNKKDLIDDIHKNINPCDYVKGAITVEHFIKMIGEVKPTDDVKLNAHEYVTATSEGAIVTNSKYEIDFDTSKPLINEAMGIAKERVDEMLGEESPLSTEVLSETMTRIARDSTSDSEFGMFMFLLGRMLDRKYR